MGPSAAQNIEFFPSWGTYGLCLKSELKAGLVIDGIQKGDFPTEGVVTHQLSLDQFEEGFELMKQGDKSLKVVLVP